MNDPHAMPRVRIVNVSKHPGQLAGYKTKIYVDDVDISRCVNGVQIHIGLKDIVTATVSLLVNAVEFEGSIPTTLTPETAEALIRLGWTPPAEGAS